MTNLTDCDSYDYDKTPRDLHGGVESLRNSGAAASGAASLDLAAAVRGLGGLTSAARVIRRPALLGQEIGMDHDVVIVGGGLAGAVLARGLAAQGVSVLVLEREREFRDRVRGEQMHCWGVAEAHRLGIYDLLQSSGGHEVRYWSTQFAGAPEAPPRNLVDTSES